MTTAPAGCPRIEEAVSARIDGEDPGMDIEVVDAHVMRCAECRWFEAAARTQHRRLRVRRATGVPDLSAQILTAVPSGPSPRPRVAVGNCRSPAPLMGAAALASVVLVAGYRIGTHLGGGGRNGGRTHLIDNGYVAQ